MNNRPRASGPPTETNAPDWAGVSIGIMTVATIIAAATAAAAISVVIGDTDEDETAATMVASVMAVASLVAYYMAVLAGLTALFLQSPPGRRLLVLWSAGLFAVQTGIGVAFAAVAILGSLLFGAG